MMLSHTAQRPGDGTRSPAVSSRSVLGVAVIHVRDASADDAAQACQALWQAIAHTPRAVVCDLTGVGDPLAPDAIRVLLDALEEALEPVRGWPGLPVAFACPPGPLRDALSAATAGHASVTGALTDALETVLYSPAPHSVVEHFPPVPSCVRVARELVARACTDWGYPDQVGPATLVASELVTNAVRHAGTDVDVRFAALGPLLHLIVRDQGPGQLRLSPCDVTGLTGRGLLLVEALARSWGVLPTGDTGKAVWALLDTNT